MPRGPGKKFNYADRMVLINRAVQLWREGVTQREIAIRLDVCQATVHSWIKRYRTSPVLRVQERIAARLRDGLVCCDIYQRLTALQGDTEAWKALRHSPSYHDICYFGEWAAQIAEKVDGNASDVQT